MFEIVMGIDDFMIQLVKYWGSIKHWMIENKRSEGSLLERKYWVFIAKLTKNCVGHVWRGGKNNIFNFDPNKDGSDIGIFLLLGIQFGHHNVKVIFPYFILVLSRNYFVLIMWS